MNPTITEQLRGYSRILDEVVAPALDRGYPSDVLAGIIANLRRLAGFWDRVLPFLEWDNRATAVVLLDAAPLLEPELAARVRRAVDVTPADADEGTDPLDFDALHDRNLELRSLLAETIVPLAGGGERTAAMYARVRSHLRERMSRYPMSGTIVMPSGG
jgi:hypothetical protein